MRRSLLRIILLGILSAAVGVGIIIVMMRLTHIDVAVLLQSFKRAKPLPLTLVMLLTIFHIWITSSKWRIMAVAVGEAEGLHGNFFGYTLASALVGQLVPQQIAAVTVRSIAGRLHQQTPMTRGAGMAIVDQFMDLLCPAALLLPAVLCLTHRINLLPGAILAIVTLAAFTIFLPRVLRFLAYLASHFHGLLVRKVRLDLKPAALPPKSILRQLFALSIVRYFNLVLRYYILARCIEMPILLITIIEATPLITLIFLISITPGALGLAELGWVGVLSAAGLPAARNMQFAIATRILTFACVAALAIVYMVMMTLYKHSVPRGKT